MIVTLMLSAQSCCLIPGDTGATYFGMYIQSEDSMIITLPNNGFRAVGGVPKNQRYVYFYVRSGGKVYSTYDSQFLIDHGSKYDHLKVKGNVGFLVSQLGSKEDLFAVITRVTSNGPIKVIFSDSKDSLMRPDQLDQLVFKGEEPLLTDSIFSIIESEYAIAPATIIPKDEESAIIQYTTRN